MCCFSTPTKVYGTKIFARFSAPGKQMLAYQMRYESQALTAMILPLPTKLEKTGKASETAVRFLNLKECGDFFEKLHSAFPEPERFSLSRGKSASLPAVEAAAVLEVHEVGDFIASFIPSVDDFTRVDARFAISKQVWAAIPEYKDYGFAVFQLKDLKGSPHPIAFEFDTRTTASLFFPTVHIHDGAVHKSEAFEHMLYAQDASFDGAMGSYAGPSSIDRGTGLVRSKTLASSVMDASRTRGLLDPTLHLHRKELIGTLPNVDTLVSRVVSASGSGCGRCSSSASSEGGGLGVAALAGLGWVIERRNKSTKRTC
jgi:MYXO-CTERM domain-containing protein